MVILLQIGTLIYARVVKANNIMNPELSCMDGKFSAYNSVFFLEPYNSVFIMFSCPSEVHGTNFLQLSNVATNSAYVDWKILSLLSRLSIAGPKSG